MAKSYVKTKRPALLNLICLLGLIGVILAINGIITANESDYGSWYKIYFGASAFLQLLFLYGIWNMRKWGANGYTVFALLNVAFLVFIGSEFVFQLIVSAVVVFGLLAYYSRMK